MKSIILLMSLSLSGLFPGTDPAIDEAKEIFSRFKACSNQGNECRNLTSELISNVYKISDLESSGQFMTNDELVQHVEKNWNLIGPAYKEDVLQSAQNKANAGKAVVAVYTDNTGQLMHVAVILPGELKPSGTWGMAVPNAVSLALYDSEHSFVNKSLSYAFKKHMLLHVRIFSYS